MIVWVEPDEWVLRRGDWVTETLLEIWNLSTTEGEQ